MDRIVRTIQPVSRTEQESSRLFSPYDLNPIGYDPLRHVLAESIETVRVHTPLGSRIQLRDESSRIEAGGTA